MACLLGTVNVERFIRAYYKEWNAVDTPEQRERIIKKALRGTEYHRGFRRWLVVQNYSVANLEVTLPAYYSLFENDRQYHMRALFRSERFGDAFKRYFSQSAYDPLYVTRAQLWQIYAEYTQRELEMQLDEQSGRHARRLYGGLYFEATNKGLRSSGKTTQSLVAAGLARSKPKF